MEAVSSEKRKTFSLYVFVLWSLDVFSVYGHKVIDISAGQEGSRITRVCKNVTAGKVAVVG